MDREKSEELLRVWRSLGEGQRLAWREWCRRHGRSLLDGSPLQEAELEPVGSTSRAAIQEENTKLGSASAPRTKSTTV